MEYQCFYLDPMYVLGHASDAIPMMETDSLAEACTFAYEHWNTYHCDIAVYQPSKHQYREIYRNPARDPGGRFCRR